jgi:3-hydroxybutyryl-CoA dehydrogenase
MNVDSIKRITVIGAGLMGHGIAIDFSRAGYDVELYDQTDAKLLEGQRAIAASLHRMQRLALIDAAAVQAIPKRITMTTELKQAAGTADIVIESVVENIAIKHTIFSELHRLCPEHTILASNTSTFKPSKLAAVTRRPEKVLVTHYFNPPYLLPLVEIVRNEKTSDETVATVHALLLKVGKQPAIVQKEVTGFIGNRLQIALLREALSLVEKGVATPQDIDIVIKNSIGRRWAFAGVFEVFEVAGWDLLLDICHQIQPELESSREPAALLKEKVKRGELGTKSGNGFYPWTPQSGEALKAHIARGLARVATLPPPSASESGLQPPV